MITTKLPDVALRSTPRRVAVRYLQWLWTFPRRGSNPLARWLKEMETEIRGKVPSSGAADDYYRKAEDHLFFILDLYTSAVTSWIREACALTSLCRMAAPCIDAVALPSLESRLGRRLIDQYERFTVQSVALEKIQIQYLQSSIPPPIYSMLVDVMSGEVRAALLITRVSIDPDPERLQSEAENEVKSLVMFARLSACAGSCSRNTRCLLEAAKMLGHVSQIRSWQVKS